ncbi:MAG TPA: hypothetical protein VGQ83_28870 [Polyangia bacterium]|jgi:hypothetical protein
MPAPRALDPVATRAPGRLATGWPVVVAAALAVIALLPAWGAAGRYSARYDWRYFDAMTEAARRTVVWYHQAPLWNPYSCGGEVGLANPQSLDGAPTFVLVLLFGTALGLKLALALYLFAAIDGTRRLGVHLGLAPPAALVAGVGFGLSGYLAVRFATGHLSFLGVTLFPTLLLCFDRSLGAEPRAWRWLVPAGLVAAWIALLGGTFTPPMAVELLVGWAALRAIERRSARPFVHLLVLGAVALAAGAVRLLPALEFVRDHPRPAFVRAPDRSTAWQVLADLVATRELAPLAGRKYWGHEYAARLPALVAILAAAALPLAALARDPGRRRVVRGLWLLAAAAALLAMGNFATLAPWSLLQRLPVLRDLRVPSRHLVLVALPLALLAGFALDAALAWLRGRGVRRAVTVGLAAAAVTLAAADGAWATARAFRGVFTVTLPSPPRPARFYHTRGHWQTMRETLFAGQGSLECDEAAPLQRAQGLEVGDVPQVRLLDAGAGQVRAASFSPNRWRAALDLGRGTTLLLNANWNEHWRARPGRAVSLGGRLAVDLGGLPPGRHEVTAWYRPRSFLAGAVVTGLTLPACLLAFALARRRRGRASSG